MILAVSVTTDNPHMGQATTSLGDLDHEYLLELQNMVSAELAVRDKEAMKLT